MNTRQKQIICTALFLLTLFILFPPWVYENTQTSAEYSAGYHFLFNPPKVKPNDEMRRQLSITDNVPTSFIVKRGIHRLINEIIAVPFLTIGFILILSNKKSLGKTVLSSISLLIGSLFTALVCLMSLR